MRGRRAHADEGAAAAGGSSQDCASPMAWIDPDFEYPARLELASGHHLRPIRRPT